MAQLFVEPAKVARARELAQEAARGVQAFIDRHGTVAIELRPNSRQSRALLPERCFYAVVVTAVRT